MTNSQDTKKNFLILTVGKVGSRSVYTTFNKLDTLRTYHFHNAPDGNLEIGSQKYNALKKSPYRHMKTLAYLVDDKVFDQKIYYLNLVRDPLARAFSHFSYNQGDQLEKIANGELTKEDFIEKVLNYKQLNYPIKWTQKELRNAINADPYKIQFDNVKGVGQEDLGNVSILSMQCELDNAEKLEHINSYLGTDVKGFERENVTSELPFGEVYKDLLKSIKLPEDFLNEFYDNQYCKYYYSEDQIEKFKHRWLGKL